jgi:hypothetical protein
MTQTLSELSLLLQDGRNVRVSAKDFSMAELIRLTEDAVKGGGVLYIEDTDRHLSLAEVQELGRRGQRYVTIG